MTNTKELDSYWGGKRKNAGRKKTGRSTKVIRVPKNFPDTTVLLDTIESLQLWKDKSDNASQTSVRWEKLRQLLSEIDEEIFAFDNEKN